MKKIISAFVGGVAVLAISIPSMASGVDGARNHGTPDFVSAKKKCKSGYVYNPETKKCHYRGSH